MKYMDLRDAGFVDADGSEDPGGVGVVSRRFALLQLGDWMLTCRALLGVRERLETFSIVKYPLSIGVTGYKSQLCKLLWMGRSECCSVVAVLSEG